jgi:uncharacterized protein (TIGR02246 family)
MHISHLLFKVAAPLFLFAFVAATSAAQSATPQAIVDDFVKAWNSHDMKAFDRLFTDDAIWVPVAAVLDEGRANIIKDLGDAHSTWAKTTTLTQSGTLKIQQVRPDVAVLLFHVHFLQDGKEVPGIDRAMIIVAVKQSDGWKIAVGQLTKQHEGA